MMDSICLKSITKIQKVTASDILVGTRILSQLSTLEEISIVLTLPNSSVYHTTNFLTMMPEKFSMRLFVDSRRESIMEPITTWQKQFSLKQWGQRMYYGPKHFSNYQRPGAYVE